MRNILDHEPWKGDLFEEGGLMLWGFSHHKEPEEMDAPWFTQKTICRLALTGEHRFFQSLMAICRGDRQFWRGIAFANTLPHAVEVENRYDPGSVEARNAVPERVMRILNQIKPGKTVLFSSKGWQLWPEFNGRYPDPDRPLDGTSLVRWGSYRLIDGRDVFAYNLPHPERQRVAQLQREFDLIMKHHPF
jgi:hypothetical protein